MSTLYVVATPIGNLKDITLRALEVLKSVDVIVCEDTRVTKKLLDHYHIQKKLLSVHQHSPIGRFEEVARFLKNNKDVAVVVDAGTPGIQDPAGQLVEYVTQLPGVTIVPVPGVSAVTAVLSIAGFNVDRFLFLGFPPHKKGRKKFFQNIGNAQWPVVLYESPHRIQKTLAEMRSVMGGDLHVVVAKELTKIHETILRGTLDEVYTQVGVLPKKGEFVIVVSKP